MRMVVPGEAMSTAAWIDWPSWTTIGAEADATAGIAIDAAAESPSVASIGMRNFLPIVSPLLRRPADPAGCRPSYAQRPQNRKRVPGGSADGAAAHISRER